MQIAHSYGPDLTVVTSPQNLETARSLGADHVVDYTKTDFAESGVRYDFILDTVGNRSVSDLKRALAEGGKAAVTGFTSVANLLVSPSAAARRSRKCKRTSAQTIWIGSPS